MRHRSAPTIRRGPHKGDQLSVHHIILGAVVSELDNVIANLELRPLRMNESENARVGERQLALAEQLHAAGSGGSAEPTNAACIIAQGVDPQILLRSHHLSPSPVTIFLRPVGISLYLNADNA